MDRIRLAEDSDSSAAFVSAAMSIRVSQCDGNSDKPSDCLLLKYIDVAVQCQPLDSEVRTISFRKPHKYFNVLYQAVFFLFGAFN